MKKSKFNQKDLVACDFQHTVRHKDVNCFIPGERVFLKSNPEHVMWVHSVMKNSITTVWHTGRNKIRTCNFPPECILQYRYAGLLIYKNKFYMSLN